MYLKDFLNGKCTHVFESYPTSSCMIRGDNFHIFYTSVFKVVSNLFYSPLALTRRKFSGQAIVNGSKDKNLCPHHEPKPVSSLTVGAITVNSGRQTPWLFVSLEKSSPVPITNQSSPLSWNSRRERWRLQGVSLLRSAIIFPQDENGSH
jgi:hypothetical protein